MITFKLNSGRKVSLISFSFNYTYGGLLIGSPNEKLNKKIISKSTYPTDWGIRKTLKLIPKQSAIENKLKPVCYCALLESEVIQSLDKTHDGSNLVVIWFGDHPNNKTIEDILNANLKKIDWEQYAENFNF